MKPGKNEERKPDINGVDEAVERHVDEMLNPNLPDTAAEKSAPKTTGKKISVFHDSDGADEASTTAPPVADKPVPKEPLKIKIVDHQAEDTVEPEITPEEPELTPEPTPAKKPVGITVVDTTDGSSEPEAVSTAPELPTEEVVPQEPATPEPTPAPEKTPEPKELEPEITGPEPPTPAEEQPDLLDDPKLDKAVDEIIASESDELLAAEDEKHARAVSKPERRSFGEGVADFFGGWWRNPITRWLTILLIVGSIGAAAYLPTTRYYALNTAGVRSGASVQVIDQSTFQPLKDVEVQLAGQTALTDAEGKATFSKLRLGPTQLTIQKRAFAPINEAKVIGWGSNPFGSRNLSPAGSQYTFIVTDYLSGKPVAKVAASTGEADAQSDEKGQIKLTLEHSTRDILDVTFTAKGYRTESLKLDVNSKQQMKLRLVPDRKEVFITKRAGKYDIYKVDIDGKNEKLVLAGTGSERDDMILLPHPNDEVVALVSTRENKRNAEGYLLSTLTLINLTDDAIKNVTSSEQIKLVNWIGSRLVFVQVAAGSSAASPNRQRLITYDYKSFDNRQLAASNYFNAVLTASGKVYYAPSASYQESNTLANFYAVNPDGTFKQTILQGETWGAARTGYDQLVLSLPGQWYGYRIGSNGATKLDGQPATSTTHNYIDSPDGKRSLWVDTRDGKGVLLAYDITTKKDEILRTQSGLKAPVRWLNSSTIIYRIQTEQETADYALSLDGGEPVKIKDVTSTGGVDAWYYY